MNTPASTPDPAASRPRTVNCPQCGTPLVWGPQSPYRPFCSARCRQIDLGAWASESYRVPGSLPSDDFETTPTPSE